MPHLKPNEMGRHAFATHAAKRGAAQIALQKFMGHTDPRTTGRYVDLAGQALVEVLRPRPWQQRGSMGNYPQKT
jgi:site-specific recombinase XerD